MVIFKSEDKNQYLQAKKGCVYLEVNENTQDIFKLIFLHVIHN